MVGAFVAVELKVATFIGAFVLWPWTRGAFWETFPRELTFLLQTIVLMAPAAFILARRPPSWSAPFTTVARLLAMACAAVAIQAFVFYHLMTWFDGYTRAQARSIVTEAALRNFTGWLILLLLMALVTGAMRAEDERARQERARHDLDRELAARAAAALKRSVHPLFLAQRLADLAHAITTGDGGEVMVHRIARHVRLLQRERGDVTRLLTEMNLLGTIERLSTFGIAVTLPEELRDVRVSKGLAAAFADLAVRETAAHRFSVEASRNGDGSVVVEITAAGPVLALLRTRLEDDRELGRTAAVQLDDRRLRLSYQIAAPHDHAPGAAERMPPLPAQRASRWLAVAIVLPVAVRVLFMSGDPMLDGARGLAVLLWLCGGAQLLMAIIARIRATFIVGLLAASAASTLMAAAVNVAAVELFARAAGMPAILIAGENPWLSLPRDAATIGTAVGLAALLAGQSRRNAWERARAVRLETLLSRADTVALETRFHPHFLFNSLNAVLALLREDRLAAQRMAARLAVLFHDVVAAGATQEWPLAREREVIEQYLDVMRVRFDDRLRVVMRIPRGLGHVRVPRLLLQPLVENAIRHGIAERTTPGSIVITAARHRPDELRIAVENDAAPAAVLPPVRGGGLSYVSERLTLLYGAESAPRCAAAAGRFRVEVTIPYLEVIARRPRSRIDPALRDTGA
ncbi:MAG TPA: histidine kinase [Thermoanaerobaculia bacterium]|nr:histidine kinase [Thermoanaerobaculia bacterium]